MIADPNEDLVGFWFLDDSGRGLRVAHTWPINEAYVVCVSHDSTFQTVRVASQLRIARTLRQAGRNALRDSRDALRASGDDPAIRSWELEGRQEDNHG